MEKANKKIIGIALIMALVATFLIYAYIKKSTGTPDVIQYANVYVAAKTLPYNHKITETDIKQVKIPKEYLNSKAVADKTEIIGKLLQSSIIEGEQILSGRLVGEGKTTLANSLPGGKRAVSINVNEEIGVSDMIRPGDFIDVIAGFEREDIEDATGKKTYPRIVKTVIQNVEVLALGQDRNITDEKLKELPKTVTLAVDPKDAEKLVYVSEYAVFRLALRSPGDKNNIDTQGIIRADLVPERR